jgi:hypothetical protein
MTCAANQNEAESIPETNIDTTRPISDRKKDEPFNPNRKKKTLK